MTMQHVICAKPGTLDLEDVATPARRPGEVQIRIRSVGVCGTDMHIFTGNQPYLAYPRVMGHELGGEVVEADAGSGFMPGQTVCVIPYISCGTCVACRKGRTNCCANIAVMGVHRDGGMAEYLNVPQDFVLDATGLSFEQAAMVEFLAIGAHAVARGAPISDERVLVVGAGPIGMAVALFAKDRGAEVTVLDGREDRVRFCIDSLGADHAVLLTQDVPARLAAVSGGEHFDVVFDATGSPRAMQAGFAYVAHAGRYVLVSIVTADISFNDPEFHKRETTLLGSRNATRDDFAYVIDAMRAGRVPTAAMHTHSAPLADVPSVFSGWMQPSSNVIKAIVSV